MAHPDGSSIQLSMEWLNPTPFTSYLLPGLVLFIFNGLMSFFVLGFVIMRHKLARTNSNSRNYFVSLDFGPDYDDTDGLFSSLDYARNWIIINFNWKVYLYIGYCEKAGLTHGLLIYSLN